jgi:hypothetical protein
MSFNQLTIENLRHLATLQFPAERRKIRCAEKYFALIGVNYLTVNPDKVGGWWEPVQNTTLPLGLWVRSAGSAKRGAIMEITKDTALIGAAGVHFVVSELSLRGFIALPTIRNTAGMDIVAVHPNGEWHANIQVKTSRSKVSFWPIGTTYHRWCGPHNHYAFVRYLAGEGRFEIFLESADRVVPAVDARVADEKTRGLKDFSPCWYLPSDDQEVERLRSQWLQFGVVGA